MGDRAEGQTIGVISVTVGIFAAALYLITLLPFLGWLNIIVVPMAAVGFFLGLNGSAGITRTFAVAGVVLNAIVAVLGLVRLL